MHSLCITWAGKKHQYLCQRLKDMGKLMCDTFASGIWTTCRTGHSCSIAWAKHGQQSSAMRTSQVRFRQEWLRSPKRGLWKQRTLSILLQAQRSRKSSPRKEFARHWSWKKQQPAGCRNLTGNAKEPEMECILTAIRGRMLWPIDMSLLSGGGLTKSISTNGTIMGMNSHAQMDSQCPMAYHSDSFSSHTMSSHSTKMTATRLHELRRPASQCHSPKVMARRSWSWVCPSPIFLPSFY